MRARNIKPGFYKNDDLAECSVWARLLAPGLWMMADREGRMEDRPKRIKGEIFPYDNIEVEALLTELEQWGHIVRYEVAGVRYIQIVAFNDHQRPHANEAASIIPPPLEDTENKAVQSALHQGGKHFALNDECLMMNDDSLNDDSTHTLSREGDSKIDQPIREGLPDLSGQFPTDITREMVTPHLPAGSDLTIVSLSMQNWRSQRTVNLMKKPDWLQDACAWVRNDLMRGRVMGTAPHPAGRANAPPKPAQSDPFVALMAAQRKPTTTEASDE